MKIKNDSVSIKIGKKKFDFHNLILNEYLKRFAAKQLSSTDLQSPSKKLEMKYCLLKFDTELEFNSNTELHNQDFDVCLVQGSLSQVQEISPQEVSIKYIYTSKWNIWDYSQKTASNNYISNYYGKKITAIGFNSHWVSDEEREEKIPVCAVLDTSSYNIYLQENQELVIARKDIITTDALFWSNTKKVKGPAHLAPLGIETLKRQKDLVADNGIRTKVNEKAYGILHSIGFSSYPDWIDEEYIINDDVEVVQNGNELIIEGLENKFSTDKPWHPQNNIYPSTSLYPIKSNYKYVILKYKLWQNFVTQTKNSDGSYIQNYTPFDIGYFYYQAFPIEKFGTGSLKIKYERS